MKEWRNPFDRPPEFVYLFRDSKQSSASTSLEQWLNSALPSFNWRSHLFVTIDDPTERDAQIANLLDMATKFLNEHRFCSLHFHVVVPLPGGRSDRQTMWDSLLAPIWPYQEEARTLLSEARLLLAPILVPSSDVSIEETKEASEFFASRLAIPSFFLCEGCLDALPESLEKGSARFFLDPRNEGLPKLLHRGHVLDSVLDRMEEGQPLLSPCSGHLVLDEKTGKVFSCFRLWERGEQGVLLTDLIGDHSRFPQPPSGELCASCVASVASAMQENLRANGREVEGREACFKLSLALGGKAMFAEAADLAHSAFELSATDADRSAALIQEALCLRELKSFQKADETLQKAAEFSRDKGLICYHRGRVQFEWRDYIEALEWFEDALELGSPEVPLEDMCFEMALSHINIEEYREARPYLDKSEKPGERKAPISFYRGVCDYGEADFYSALEHFRDALSLGPTPEDLSRVLYYVGASLKELERYEEAIDVLREAVAADAEDIANHNLLGFCCYKLKRHEEAVACFLRAVEIDPKSGIDWANLGSNLRDLGRVEDAVLMYKKALSLDPTLGFAKDNLKKLQRRT